MFCTAKISNKVVSYKVISNKVISNKVITRSKAAQILRFERVAELKMQGVFV